MEIPALQAKRPTNAALMFRSNDPCSSPDRSFQAAGPYCHLARYPCVEKRSVPLVNMANETPIGRTSIRAYLFLQLGAHSKACHATIGW